ncbi:amylo-alpha-1,6-glucosidase [Acidisphaera rubrifaciens]|uniref:Amylo-alpha-16-glucosidase n=1 Tax=Acidisphaera rubrifaciens HS-AP3 TaxID=1231350 RepID=A0A0D6P8Z0_9PROT|nr:glycogen debranching N-terminal domain-containing protein [Acidisphaera rubrifaciens]GAN77334.1 amylo-alpha-16-glucosidase [Acidisphaera rubrifaciens HS-AP3]
MPFKVQVGPPQISIHHGQTVLLTEESGAVNWPTDKGLYFLDTRLLSAWAIYANGVEWELLNGGGIAYDTARIHLTNRDIPTQDATITARSLGLVIGRTVAGGLHEDLDLANHSNGRIRFSLEVSMRSDFADIFEVKSGRIVRRGRIATEWSEATQTLTTTYSNADFMRAVSVEAVPDGGARAAYANGRLSFDIDLPPGGRWHCCLLYTLIDGERRFPPPVDCTHGAGATASADTIAHWRETVLKLRTSNEEVYRLYAQAVEDMGALRLPMVSNGHSMDPAAHTDQMVFLPAAGLPWFVAPFGRDSLIVSLQNLLVYPDFARGALDVLGRLQAQERDDWRDAEPGKILHEMRYGELAHFKLIPHTPYYGTADATPLWLITLHATWRCTGERALLEAHLPVAERCLSWIDEWGDRDGDGLQEYQTRSPVGYENMAWKDSGDAVLYEDGSLVRGPKALCELQGYVYDAWLRMAEVFDVLGKPDRAATLRAKAAKLYATFNELFWDEARGYYAYTLDGDKKPVFSLASNIGHCLWSGIVPPERAARVVERLMRPDMWSGWGIRTLSAEHKAFNPYAYQLGSVWPHDNAIIALGFKRYGFAAEAGRIARDISGAASHFQSNQLPELYAGIQRDGTNFPVQYLGANVPQAWAAGSVFMLLQSILGIVPAAPERRLYVDPVLPHWLPDVTLVDMRVGDQVFDIHFTGNGDGAAFEVLRGDPAAVVRRPMGAAGRALGSPSGY